MRLQAAAVTWDTGYTYVTQTGVAADAYAQLIPGTVVEAKYADMSRTSLLNVQDAYQSRSIDFSRFTPGGSGGGYGGLLQNTGDSVLDILFKDGYQGANGRFSIYWDVVGLTAGQNYQIQIFSQSEGWRVNNSTFFGSGTYNGAWFVKGSFVADASSQRFTLGYQAGDINPSAGLNARPAMTSYMVTSVPEPSCLSLFLVGFGACLLRRRGIPISHESVTALSPEISNK
ncbi:MAG: PEP-CTERM sorting domain-containing protein [Aliarcobacter sp.]